jgi:hypothetical protein
MSLLFQIPGHDQDYFFFLLGCHLNLLSFVLGSRSLAERGMVAPLTRVGRPLS